MLRPWRPRSVRTYLLAWIITPIALFIVIDTFTLYHNALDSVNAAYDRMLVTTAYSVGDEVRYQENRLDVSVSFASLEVYEAGFSTRMLYRVSDTMGNYVAGDVDLPAYADPIPGVPASPTLLGIREGRYGNAEVRVASIVQPVPSGASRVGAVVQIAEPIEFRRNVARHILLGTLGRQAMLLAVVALVTMYVVTHALRPLEALRGQLDARRDDELSELSLPRAPHELQPVVNALNMLMERLRRQLDLQQRFVADASHQLRTPLAVLKTQLQSGLRGDAPPSVVLAEMAGTVDRATNLANKLLSLAKVEQLRGKGGQVPCNLSAIVSEVAVDLSPLISEKNLDFELKSYDAWVIGHPWMVGEMVSNLLHNAIQHTPQGGRLGVAIDRVGGDLFLRVWDTGLGIARDLEESAFEPFAASYASKGGGLGLTICAEIADSMHASLTLKNRVRNDVVEGLDAVVSFRNSAPATGE
jgi:two-component system, OmpR family, sensor histidine kinase TctE